MGIITTDQKRADLLAARRALKTAATSHNNSLASNVTNDMIALDAIKTDLQDSAFTNDDRAEVIADALADLATYSAALATHKATLDAKIQELSA